MEWVRQCEPLLVTPTAFVTWAMRRFASQARRGPILMGANFAGRASEQRRFRYDTELGLAPGRQRLGEESKVIGSILDSGAIGYWLPDARIEHFVRHEQQSTAHIVRYFAANGETLAFARISRETGPRYSVSLAGCGGSLRRAGYAIGGTVWSSSTGSGSRIEALWSAKGGFRYWWNR